MVAQYLGGHGIWGPVLGGFTVYILYTIQHVLEIFFNGLYEMRL